MMTSKLAQLQARRMALGELATRLNSEERRLSTSLEPNDEIVTRAQACGVQIVSPLTIGTLLAAVLSEIDGTELAIEGVRRNERPGEDNPDPLAPWQHREPQIDARRSA